MTEILFATEIAFRGLNRCMSEQKLNLLKLAATVMAQLRTSPAQIVWCNVIQTNSPAASPHHTPDNVLRDAIAPHLSQSSDRSKDTALFDVGCACPLVQSGFDPIGDRHRADVATFANQINRGPVSLSHLDFVQL